MNKIRRGEYKDVSLSPFVIFVTNVTYQQLLKKIQDQKGRGSPTYEDYSPSQSPTRSAVRYRNYSRSRSRSRSPISERKKTDIEEPPVKNQKHIEPEEGIKIKRKSKNIQNIKNLWKL